MAQSFRRNASCNVLPGIVAINPFVKSSKSDMESTGSAACDALSNFEAGCGISRQVIKDRIGMIASFGTISSIYRTIKTKRPIFDGVRYRIMIYIIN